MEGMSRIGKHLDQLKGPVGYPVLRSIDALGSKANTLPTLDGWNRRHKLISDPGGYFIVSAGKDGQFEQTDPNLYQPGPTLQFKEDIVYSDGLFIRKPEKS